MAEMRLQVQSPYSLQIQGIVGDLLINVRQEPMWFMFSDAICRWRNDSNFSNNYPLLHAAPELKLHDRTSALLSACLSFGCDIPSFRNKNRRKSYSGWTNTLPLVRSDFEWVCVSVRCVRVCVHDRFRVCVCVTVTMSSIFLSLIFGGRCDSYRNYAQCLLMYHQQTEINENYYCLPDGNNGPGRIYVPFFLIKSIEMF